MSDIQPLIAALKTADSSNPLSFSRMIRWTQAALGLSDVDLAKALDTSVPNVRRWREGTVHPPAHQIVIQLLLRAALARP